MQIVFTFWVRGVCIYVPVVFSMKDKVQAPSDVPSVETSRRVTSDAIFAAACATPTPPSGRA